MPFTISSSSHTPNSSNLLAPRAITFNVVGDSMSAQHLPPMSAEPHCLVTSPPKPPEPLKRAAVRDFSTQSIHLGTWAFPTGGGGGDLLSNVCFNQSPMHQILHIEDTFFIPITSLFLHLEKIPLAFSRPVSRREAISARRLFDRARKGPLPALVGSTLPTLFKGIKEDYCKTIEMKLMHSLKILVTLDRVLFPILPISRDGRPPRGQNIVTCPLHHRHLFHSPSSQMI